MGGHKITVLRDTPRVGARGGLSRNIELGVSPGPDREAPSGVADNGRVSIFHEETTFQVHKRSFVRCGVGQRTAGTRVTNDRSYQNWNVTLYKCHNVTLNDAFTASVLAQWKYPLKRHRTYGET